MSLQLREKIFLIEYPKRVRPGVTIIQPFHMSHNGESDNCQQYQSAGAVADNERQSDDTGSQTHCVLDCFLFFCSES